MFRPSDERRVQAAFDTDLIPPYEAALTLSADRRALRATVVDPDNPALTVATAEWHYDASKPSVKQPTDNELGEIVQAFMVICSEYTAAKGAGE